MTIDFILTMWVCYCAQMNARPKPTMDSCQKVLYYLLQEVKLVVRSWRKRQQHYSSASIFKTAGAELKHWVFGDPAGKKDEISRKQVKETLYFENTHLHFENIHLHFETHICILKTHICILKTHICILKYTFVFLKTHMFHYTQQVKKRSKMLRNLTVDEVMFDLIGDAMMRFMKDKSHPFPNALLSRKHFNRVPVWKKAQVYIRLIRNVLDIHANSHWNKYGYVNYKFNVVVFNSYCEKNDEIWKLCKSYLNLPEDFVPPAPQANQKNLYTPTKKRSRSCFELSTPEHVSVTPKFICLLSDESSSSEDDSAANHS